MADFQTGVVEAGVQLAVQHGAAAHTGAQSDGHHGLAALARTGGVLAQRRGVGVVLNIDLLAQTGLEHLGQRHIVEVQVGPVLHNAVLGVNDAGRTDAHRLDVVHGEAPGGQCLTGRLGHGSRHSLCAGAGRGDLAPAENGTRFIHYGGGHVDAAQVNAQILHKKTSSLVLFVLPLPCRTSTAFSLL